MNIFSIYFEKIKKFLIDLEKDKQIKLSDNLNKLTIELPPKDLQGDISCNAALVLSKINNKKPKDIAILLKINLITSFPEFNEPGWRGRVAKELFGSKSKRPKTISKIISDGYSTYRQKLDEIGKNSIGTKIDPNVTVDIHRIFRLEGSLNGKSGLAKLNCENIEKFNPYSEACLIEDNQVEIFGKCPIEFRLKKRKKGGVRLFLVLYYVYGY